MSAPSDVSDMSVTFTNSQYPYATYAGGILNIFMNMDDQYNSEADFQNAIKEALTAGGVTLPDDLELNFEFETVPDAPEAVIAKNSIDSWKYTTKSATCDAYTKYTYTDADGSTSTKSARIAFSCPDNTRSDKVTISYNSSATEDVKITGSPEGNATGEWTIEVGPNVTAEKINKAITKYIQDKLEATPSVEVPKLTCTTFVLPEAGGTPDNRQAAFDAFAALTWELKGNPEGAAGSLGVSIDAKIAGEYANNYKITFAYSGSYDNTKAVWDENNLTITVCNNSTLADIQAAVTAAANGDEKKMLQITGMSGLANMNAAQRKALFEGNPALSLGGGEDSFFTAVAKSLSTFNLTNGRTGSAQTVKDLEDVTIQNDGTIIGTHAILGRITLGRIDLATFDNPNGLLAVGGTSFAETVASGAAKLGIPGSTGTGEVISGALEMSNVDLSQEFTDMITTQRGYQANSRVITTSDTMLEELLSLKR